MTRDEIILQLAEQAGLHDVLGSWCQECGCTNDMLLRFAELVAAAEREACAKVCEDNADCCNLGSPLYTILSSNAAAIRARGIK